MKATELMLGDWVYAKVQVDDTGTEPVFERTPKRVTDLTNSINGIYVEGTSQFAGAEIEPIPITPEILEKNGCKRYDEATRRDGIYKYEVGSSRCIVVFYQNPLRNPFIECENATCRMQREIIYIHELQHALRLCGIDKEIVL